MGTEGYTERCNECEHVTTMARHIQMERTVLSDKWLHINEDTGQTKIIGCNIITGGITLYKLKCRLEKPSAKENKTSEGV